jgi:hypothetical protein
MDPVAICNLALGWLGASLVNQLNAEAPETTEEELCAANYPAALKAVLEARAWTFATGRLTLEPGEASGVAEYPRRFAIPATAVRVLACDDGSGYFDIAWVREGGYVLTADALDKVYAKAVLLVEDALKFPAEFARAVAARLAADLAVPLTENRSLAADMEARFRLELKKAATHDGMQGRAEQKTSSWLRNARG